MLSSPSSRRGGMKYSRAARSFPRGLRIGVTAIGQSCVGAIIMKPSGRRCRRPRRTTNVRRQFELVCTSWPVSPRRRHRSRPHGTVVMKLSALCSTWKPSRWTVETTPPSREPASKSVTWHWGASSRNRCAAASPEIPPPITAIRRVSGKRIFEYSYPDFQSHFSQPGFRIPHRPSGRAESCKTSSWLGQRFLLRFPPTTPQTANWKRARPTFRS